MMAGVLGSAGRLAGAYGILIIALREGLTVRGYYNPSISASVTIGTGVSALADLHTSGNNYAQGTSGLQPTYTANDGTLLGRGTITGDGSDDVLVCTTYATPAPGTTPVYIQAVMKQIGWTAGRAFWGANAVSSTCCACAQTFGGASPQMRCNNGTAGPSNSGATLGSWARIEAQYQNTTGDYFKCIGTSVTGTNLGNTSTGTGRRVLGTLGSVSNTAFAMLLQCEGTANSRFRAFADYWTTNYFGPGLV